VLSKKKLKAGASSAYERLAWRIHHWERAENLRQVYLSKAEVRRMRADAHWNRYNDTGYAGMKQQSGIACIYIERRCLYACYIGIAIAISIKKPKLTMKQIVDVSDFVEQYPPAIKTDAERADFLAWIRYARITRGRISAV